MTEPAPPARPTPAWQVALAWLLLVLVYGAVSLARWRTLSSSSFDLGVFVQVVSQWAHLQVPVVHLTNDSLVAAHHFSPALAVLAPAYAVVPSPLTLLAEQALLVATGVVPLMRHAGRYGRVLPWAVAASYGLAPGLASLVGFDVHEVALAVPLLAFSMVALLEGRHRAAVLWALPIVLVKEDLGLTLAAIGLVVLLRGSRRLGVVTVVVGLATAAVTVLWVLPALDGSGYYYSDAFAPSGPVEAWHNLTTATGTKLDTVRTLLLPTAVLALGSPLALVLLPTLGWRFVSSRQNFWVTGFQYDAVLVPVATAAALDVVRRLPRRAVPVVAVVMLALTAFLLPRSDVGELLLHPDHRQPQERTGELLEALAVVPDGARVAASNDLGPRLVSRTELYFFGDPAAEVGPVTRLPDFRRIDWIAYDRAYESVVPAGRTLLDRLVESGRFRVVTERGGVLVAQRVASGS